MKIYLNSANESWVVDRFKEEWVVSNPKIVTKNIKEADIIWLIAPWTWKKIPKRHLKNKFVLCTIHHIDFDKFDKNEEKNFKDRDFFVNVYHSISDKTTEQLMKLTKKNVKTIPFWINQNIFFQIKDKTSLRRKFDISSKSFLIGSFQRDTEGKDLVSPKLSKGPDRLIEIFKNYHNENKNVEILLTGKRRNYLVNQLSENNIPYKYYEMTSFEDLNELYNCLDLYVVASRVEGGPQAILECAITKTPIISTDVGIASKILNKRSIFTMDNFSNAQPSVSYSYKNALKYTTPNWHDNFIDMFESIK